MSLAHFSTPTGSSITSAASNHATARDAGPTGLAISVISLAELYEGIHYSRDPARSRAVLIRFLAGVSVLPVDDGVCDIFGRECGKLRQQGKLVGDFDLLIAATCLRHGLTLCSNNWRHFDMVDGLQILSVP